MACRKEEEEEVQLVVLIPHEFDKPHTQLVLQLKIVSTVKQALCNGSILTQVGSIVVPSTGSI